MAAERQEEDANADDPRGHHEAAAASPAAAGNQEGPRVQRQVAASHEASADSRAADAPMAPQAAQVVSMPARLSDRHQGQAAAKLLPIRCGFALGAHVHADAAANANGSSACAGPGSKEVQKQ